MCKHYQPIRIDDLVQPMTGPELVRWARFHNLQFVEHDPDTFVEFSVQRCDLKPLEDHELSIFRNLRWYDSDAEMIAEAL
jgi:hypothetical protein